MAAGNINPRLLELARVGSWEALDALFQQGEEGVDDQTNLLVIGELKGVTSHGDTALHVVASNGDDKDFLKSAATICNKDRTLLSVKNHKGDTPLHCARRAGNPKMVSYLIDLAGPEAAPRDINPLLLFSARVGSWRALGFLFRQAQDPPMMIPADDFRRLLKLANRTIAVPRAGDIEAGVTPDLPAEPPAPDGGEGVTPDQTPAGGGGAGVTSDHDTETPAGGGGEGITSDQDTETPAGGGEEGVGPPADLLTAARELLKGVTPDGDSALHAVASNGDAPNFLKYAGMICDWDKDLLFSKNHNGDTPLHCAARAGNSRMVSRLIALARGPEAKLALLRLENYCNETALHEAIRFEDGRILGPKDGDALFDADGAPTKEKIKAYVEQQGMTIVKELMRNDPRLADYPVGGISPLYLTILLGKSTIALTLFHGSDGNLSYSGANGQNALHVAVLRDKDTVMVKCLVHWKKGLTTQVDEDGSTPLHFASAMVFWTGSYLGFQPLIRPTWRPFIWFPWRSTMALLIVLEGNPAALYQADKKGLFPIHVVASVGARGALSRFLWICPDSAGLRDAKGKTFLHVAIEKKRVNTVLDVCGKPSLSWILNIQDNDGNTALHLAIQARSFRMFCALFGNREVNMNLTNKQGETPRDLSISMLRGGKGYFVGNSETQICNALWAARANQGAHRWDKSDETYSGGQEPEDDDKESDRLKDATQKYMVASVLIATMAFSAAFGIPGGYITDHNGKGGTPMLAGGYIFDAFIMATALAFICSLLATSGFMIAGVPMVNLVTRRISLSRSGDFFSSSVTCISITFSLGVYMVLAPVARKTAIAICAITPGILVGREIGFLYKTAILARPLLIRKGLFLGMVFLLRRTVFKMARLLWPLIVIFGWGALARIQLSRPQLLNLLEVVVLVILFSYILIIALSYMVMGVARIQWRHFVLRVIQ